MKTLNPHVYPQGGYRFVDSEGNRFSASNATELADSVREFRLRLGKPVGTPYEEVVAYLCAQDPTACREPGPAPRAPVGVPTGVMFGGKVQRWIIRIGQALSLAQTPLVSRTEAARRAEICLKCPRQTSWRTGCGGCDATAIRASLALRQGKELSGSQGLRGCEILAEDTRSSVWLNQKPVASADLPVNCWRKAP